MTRTTTAARAVGPSISDMAASFDLHLAGEQRSDKTRRVYGRAVELLGEYLRGNGMPTHIGAITREHVEAFMASLSTRGWKPASSNQAHRSLVQFWKFVLAEGETRRNPMANLKAPRIPEVAHTAVRPADFSTLLQSIKGESFAAKRDRAILHLFYDAGLRRAELAGLRRADVSLKERQVMAEVRRLAVTR